MTDDAGSPDDEKRQDRFAALMRTAIMIAAFLLLIVLAYPALVNAGPSSSGCGPYRGCVPVVSAIR